MGFIKICGLEGKVYVPDMNCSIHKKHACNDCFSCQMCSDERCMLCKKQVTESCPSAEPFKSICNSKKKD